MRRAATLIVASFAFGAPLCAPAHATQPQIANKSRSAEAQAAFHTCMSAANKAYGTSQMPPAVHRQAAMKCDATAGK